MRNYTTVNLSRHRKKAICKRMKELKSMVHDEKNGLDYILVGDYYIPLLKVMEETRDIGFYGCLRRNYLKNTHF